MDFNYALQLLRKEECHPRCVDGVHEACFVNDKDDPGGATCCGIIQRTYDAFRLGRDQKQRDVRLHTWEEFETLYHDRFWKRGNCGALPWPLSLIHFDACVNHGTEPKNAAGKPKINAGKLLQQALLMEPREVDGIVGPVTLRLATLVPLKELCCRYLLERFFRYDKLVDARPQMAKFLHGGWERRIEHLYAEIYFQ